MSWPLFVEASPVVSGRLVDPCGRSCFMQNSGLFRELQQFFISDSLEFVNFSMWNYLPAAGICISLRTHVGFADIDTRRVNKQSLG